MQQLALNQHYNLYQKEGRPLISSRQVAEIFSKEHKNVLRDIDKLTASKNGLSDEFSRLNFEPSNYRERGKTYPQYLLTKDGFTMLIMGYTGKKALQFKEEYIRRFNQMEEYIKVAHLSRSEFPRFTEAIQQAHPEPKPHHFIIEVNMIYSIVLGMGCKVFRQQTGISKTESIKQHLTAEQLKQVETLQAVDIGLMVTIPAYVERKAILQSYFDRMTAKLTA